MNALRKCAAGLTILLTITAGHCNTSPKEIDEFINEYNTILNLARLLKDESANCQHKDAAEVFHEIFHRNNAEIYRLVKTAQLVRLVGFANGELKLIPMLADRFDALERDYYQTFRAKTLGALRANTEFNNDKCTYSISKLEVMATTDFKKSNFGNKAATADFLRSVDSITNLSKYKSY